MNLTDIESEHRVLSGMLHSEKACADALLTLEEKDFTDEFNQRVFSLMQSLYIGSVRPTLAEIMKQGLQTGLITGAQAATRLSDISSNYIDDGNIGYWTDKVKTKARVRVLDSMLKKYQAALASIKDSEADTILTDASNDFASLSLETTKEVIQDPSEVAKLGYDLVVEKMERYRKNMNENTHGAPILDGVSTGIDTLDAFTLGYKPGDLVIVAAKTGDGKTSFALNATEAASVTGDSVTLYINTEMSKQQIALRWGAILSGINHDKIKYGSITNEELSTIAEAYGRLEQSKFYPVNVPNLNPAKLQSLARIAKLKKDAKLVILDYIGRMDTSGGKDPEWKVLYNIVKTMKQMAQNLEVAIIVLVQITYEGFIQGSKQIKNECDLMLELVPLEKDEENELGFIYEKANYKLIVVKNRDGKAGDSIPIYFNKETQRIKQAVRICKEGENDRDSEPDRNRMRGNQSRTRQWG